MDACSRVLISWEQESSAIHIHDEMTAQFAVIGACVVIIVHDIIATNNCYYVRTSIPQQEDRQLIATILQAHKK
jgi:hypothetical protein